VEESGWNFLGAQFKGEQLKAALAAGLLVKKEQGGSYDRFRDRIVFPLYDLRGRVIGFGGRIVGEGQPKYLNSPESAVFDKSSTLLGLYQQGGEIRTRGRAVLVEGNFDCVSLVVHGCTNVVAPLGTALTRQQLGLLKRFTDEVILLFDGDAAGIKAARRAVPLFLAEQVKGRVALLPEGHDPDTYVRELGRASLDDLLDAAEGLPEFALEQLVAEHGLTLDGKSRIVEGLRPLVQAAASDLQRSVVIAHFSERLGVPPEQLTALLKGATSRSSPPLPQSSQMQVGCRSGFREERLEPMSSAQKRLVGQMILYPRELTRLEEAGVREMVAGTMGEVLFLQLGALQAATGEVEPEDLLAALPDGAERRFVSDVLLAASENDQSAIFEAEPEEEMAEILLWLERERLQARSRQLIAEISQAERDGDMGRLTVLLLQKQEVESQMRGRKSG
ncbi:MAG: toprim domain-containing protein, partial [Desulfobulbaceae bacterium]|nr:toprim domain-containing protein [Candidatus Desulfatifera sulfidica]